MNLKELIHDDNAVSPVIGVILMVAITVILAAVIASFVLGLGDQAQQTTPTASFSFDYTQTSGGHDSLVVTHDGGDTIESARVNATVNGADDSSGSSADAVFGDGASDGNLFGSSGDITAGSSYTLDQTDFHDGSTGSVSELDLSGATIRVVYSDASGDSSSTLATWEGPSA